MTPRKSRRHCTPFFRQGSLTPPPVRKVTLDNQFAAFSDDFVKEGRNSGKFVQPRVVAENLAAPYPESDDPYGLKKYFGS